LWYTTWPIRIFGVECDNQAYSSKKWQKGKTALYVYSQTGDEIQIWWMAIGDKSFFLQLHTWNAGFALFPIAQMAKRLTYNIITGNDPHLRMCFYYSPHFDQNIWRRGSTLTGERTKKDPAFKGFRQSSNRLKQASPIAASLYKEVPEQVKRYALFRTLTGEAIRMLKEGMDAPIITEILKKKYIDPLLETPRKNSENRRDEQPATSDRVKGMRDFTLNPHMASGVRKMTRTRRAFLLQKITEGQSAAEYFSSTDSDRLAQSSRNISASPGREPEPPEEPRSRTKTTSGLIYLGHLPECKKLKIWVRQVDSSFLGTTIAGH